MITKLGTGYLDIIAILLLFALKSKRPRAIFYGITLSAKFFLINCLKMIYLEARPYWVDKRLPPAELECAADYANPSGSALLITAFALNLALDIIANHLVQLYPFALLKGSKAAWRCVTVILFLLTDAAAYALAYFVSASRFEVKANAWNQILYGMLLGVWFGCVGFFILFEPLRAHLRALHRAE